MGNATRGGLIAAAIFFALSCGGGGPEQTSGSATAVTSARFRAAHDEFVAATQALAGVEALGTSAAPGVLAAARSRFDAAYEREQKALAVFLTLAANKRPESNETREALALYALRAVANARLLLDHGVDPARAVRMLETAGHPFRELNLPMPPELATCLAQARQRAASSLTPGRAAGVAGD